MLSMSNILTHLFTQVTSQGALLAEGGGAGAGFGGLLPILLMFGVVYFIVLRPMSKQEKERRKRVDGLKKGDQVVVGGGILGRISNADDPKVAVVEIADRVKIRVLKKDIVDTQAAALADDKAGASKSDSKDDKKAAKDTKDTKDAKKDDDKSADKDKDKGNKAKSA